jgi:thioesterase domain-containing protein
LSKFQGDQPPVEYRSRIAALPSGQRKMLARRLREKLRSLTAAQSQIVQFNTSGARPPLFCIHPSGGDVMCYSEFAARLGPDRSVCAIRAKGLEEGEEPLSAIEAMAEDYIEQIGGTDAVHPYLLGGWSMGAIVAFEMARKLVAMGRTVRLLALFDMWVPDEGQTEIDNALVLTALMGRHLPVSLELLRRLTPDEQLGLVLKEAKQAGVVSAYMDTEYARRVLRLCRTNDNAVGNYSPGPYPGKIVLFRSLEERDARFGGRPATSDPSLGWDKYAEQGVDIHYVPGNHDNLMVSPQVEHLAAALKAYL